MIDPTSGTFRSAGGIDGRPRIAKARHDCQRAHRQPALTYMNLTRALDVALPDIPARTVVPNDILAWTRDALPANT